MYLGQVSEPCVMMMMMIDDDDDDDDDDEAVYCHDNI